MTLVCSLQSRCQYNRNIGIGVRDSQTLLLERERQANGDTRTENGVPLFVPPSVTLTARWGVYICAVVELCAISSEYAVFVTRGKRTILTNVLVLGGDKTLCLGVTITGGNHSIKDTHYFIEL